jgi:hypothetical protein
MSKMSLFEEHSPGSENAKASSPGLSGQKADTEITSSLRLGSTQQEQQDTNTNDALRRLFQLDEVQSSAPMDSDKAAAYSVTTVSEKASHVVEKDITMRSSDPPTSLPQRHHPKTTRRPTSKTSLRHITDAELDSMSVSQIEEMLEAEMSHSSLSDVVREAEEFGKLWNGFQQLHRTQPPSANQTSTTPLRKVTVEDHSDHSEMQDPTHPSMYKFNPAPDLSKTQKSMQWSEVLDDSDNEPTEHEDMYKFNYARPLTPMSPQKSTQNAPLPQSPAAPAKDTKELQTTPQPAHDTLLLDNTNSSRSKSQKSIESSQSGSAILQFLKQRIFSLEQEKENANKKIQELEADNAQYQQDVRHGTRDAQEDASSTRETDKDQGQDVQELKKKQELHAEEAEAMLPNRSQDRLKHLRTYLI